MNPSDRILKTINLCENTGVRETNTALNGWKKALHQPTDHLNEISDSTLANRLISINNQIDILETTLISKNIPQHLFSEYLPSLRKAFSPLATNGQWGGVTKLLSPQLKVALQWSSWAIGEVEKTISENDLEELINSLNELDTLIAEPSLPEPLRALIQKNVREIREALELYPIIGADGLKQAAERFFGEALFQQEILRSAKDASSPSTQKTYAKFVKTVKDVVDTFNTTVTTHENTLKLGSLVATLQLPF